MSSTYHGRRAPNVSQYLHNLNTVPSNHDLPSDINLEGDLDFLTNAEFFDFDSFHPHHVDAHHPPHAARDGDHKPHRVNGPQYQFGEFQTYSASSPGTNGLHGAYPPQPLTYTAQTGDKRKASVSNSLPSAADLEEQSRMAAEEDKRRRNTAASARFRVKKKQREQALEKQSKEMAEKVQQLEGKVQQLEMENKWLKGLITDKNDGKMVEAMQREKDAGERKAEEHTTGVGTEVTKFEVELDDEDVEEDADVADEE